MAHLLEHAVRRGDFVLRSGRRSDWFIDAKQTTCRPDGMLLVADAFLAVLPDDITAIGGLTSLPGAVMGAVIIQSVKYFGEPHLQGLSLLVTGPGLLAVLLVLPGGFAEGAFKLRDRQLRWIANRRGIHVPSLVADRRVEIERAEHGLIEEAEQSVVEAESFDVLKEATIRCPVCDELLSLDAAVEHDHLQVATTGVRRRS